LYLLYTALLSKGERALCFLFRGYNRWWLHNYNGTFQY